MIPRFHRLLVIAVLIAGSLLSAGFYAALPPRVPIHWNLRGQADGFGSAWIVAFVLPAWSWLIMALLLFVPLLGRRRSNFVRLASIYGRICVTIASMLVAIQLLILARAAGKSVPLERALPAVAGLVIAIVGNWFGKIRRNAWVGIRTPWTLIDDEVWERTNRLGGKLAVAFGLAQFIVSLVAPPLTSIAFLLAGAITLCLWAFVYSYRLHRTRVAEPPSH